MRTVGLIGGTSWHSTIVYYRMINEMVSETIGDGQNPPLWMHSLNIQLMRDQDWNKVSEKFLEISQKLEQAGAEAIAICANTPHIAAAYVEPRIGIPILHIADATGAEAARLGMKRLGLLGNRPTMTGDFIPGRLKERFDIETLLPGEGAISRSNYFVSKELTRGKFTEKAKEFYRGCIQNMVEEQSVDGIILGCTELPILMEGETADVPLLGTTQLHARMIADFILS